MNSTAQTHSGSLLRAVARDESVRGKTRGSRVRFERSRLSLAGGGSSGLRRNARPYPLFFTHGAGSTIFDVDGNRYIDYGLGWGPLILGHAHPEVGAAIARQASRGLTFGAQHDLEWQVAERLTAILPCAESICFAST